MNNDRNNHSEDHRQMRSNQEVGKLSREPMTDPSPDGLVNYLIYIIVGLVSSIFALVQKHFGARISKIEDHCAENRADIQDVDGKLVDKMDEGFTRLDKRLEARRLETKNDVKDLHSKIESGHAEILREIRKNGHG